MDEQILKYFLRELSDDERQKLLVRIEKDESLKEEFIKLKKIQSYSQLIVQPSDKNEGERNFHLFSNKYLYRNNTKLLPKILKYVAIVAIIIGFATFAIQRFSQSRHEFLTFTNTSDSTVVIELEDGSFAWLNANTTLEYPASFAKGSRRVMVDGEAYFDVASENGRPFIVNADEFEVIVFGTQFNINCFSNMTYSQVTLVEGNVEVSVDGKKYGLLPGQQLFKEHSNESVEIREVNVMDYTWWRDGVYSFKSVNLEEVLRVAELWFDVEFVFVNNNARSMIFNGALLKSESIDDFLSRVEATSSCRFVKQNDVIKIY